MSHAEGFQENNQRKLVFTLAEHEKYRKSSVFSADKNLYLLNIYYSPIIIDEDLSVLTTYSFKLPKLVNIITIPSMGFPGGTNGRAT